MQITNKITKLFVTLAVTFVAFGMIASSASAVTQAQLIAAGFSPEQAAIVLALMGGSTTSAPAATSCQTFGLPGVAGIQQAVNALGYQPALVVDGVTGPRTRAGVQWAQALVGTNADGVWGPMTQAAYVNYVNANCAAAPAPTTPSTPSTSLNGVGDPDLSSTNLDVESIVREGATEKVLGMEVRATDGDIQITNLRVQLKNVGVNNNVAPANTTQPNRRPDRYLSEVSVWMEDTKIASANPANMTRNGNVYSANISLNNAIVREGVNNRKNFYIGFTALSNIDSNDIDHADFEITVDNVRFVDGTGVVLVDSFIGTSNAAFEDSTDSGEIRLRQSLGANTPEEQSIQVNESSSTSNVELLQFSLRPEAVDMEINEIWVALEAANLGAGKTIAHLINDIRLMQGNTTVASISSGFDVDLNPPTSTIFGVKFELPSQFKIEEGDTEDFRVVVRLKQQDGNFANGSTLRASLNAVAAEDMDGNTITNFTGSAAGFTQTLFVEGATISFVSSSSQATNQDNTSRDYTVVFDVTAIGQDVQVNRTSFTATGVEYAFADGDTEGDAGITATLSSNAQLNAGVYTVFEGQTRRFTLTVNASAGATQGLKKLQITGVAGIAPASLVEGTAATLN